MENRLGTAGLSSHGATWRPCLAAEAICKADAGIRGDPDPHDLLDTGRIEVFRGLARVAAGDKKIRAGSQPPILKWTNQSTAKLLH